jgi:hypothetical protein
MRVLRVLLGVVAIVVAVPLLLGAGAVWTATQHRAADGSFTAPLAPLRTDGYALVVPDVDGLLRRAAPFTRTAQTTVRFAARTPAGPAFVGLAPRAAVEHYLAGVPYSAMTEVRLARGGLPVTLAPVAGDGSPPPPPVDQTFWVAASTLGALSWSPSAVRAEHLALVVMAPDGSAPVEVAASAAMLPGWLDPAEWALLILGTLAFLAGLVLLLRPRRRREVVYVVEPSQVPELAARLGVSTVPLAGALDEDEDAAAEDPFAIFDPPEPDLDLDLEPDLPLEPAPTGAANECTVLADEPTEEPAVHHGAPSGTGSDWTGPDWTGPDWSGPSWTWPTPVPTGQPGTYRSYSAPPGITPSFLWPPMPAAPAGSVGSR